MNRTRVVAAFDVDGTLTRRDTLLPFLRAACGWRRLLVAVLTEWPHIGRALVTGRGRDEAKEALMTRTLAGLPMPSTQRVAEDFARELVLAGLRPDVVEWLRWHRRNGHEVLIVSASPTLYLEPLGRLIGAGTVLATQLEVDDSGRLTGRLGGRNCRAAEKVVRLRQHLGDGHTVVWAYGNSGGDSELLAFADRPVRVGRRRLPPPLG